MDLLELQVFLLVASAVVVTVVKVAGVFVVNGVKIYLLIQKDKREKKKLQKQMKQQSKKPRRK